MTRALAPEGNPNESRAPPCMAATNTSCCSPRVLNADIPKQIAGVPITRIGEILSGKQMTLATADGKTHPLKPAGWEHFGG